MKKRRLVVFGGESTGAEIAELARDVLVIYDEVLLVYIKEGFINDNEISNLFALNTGWINEYIIAVIDNKTREICISGMRDISNFQLVNVVHPRAYVAKSAKLGRGIYVAAGAVISSSATIGDYCHINYNVSVGHHSRLATGVSLLPGCRVSGNVKIGINVLVGSNAVIFQSVTIGDYSLIDALTYIKKDMPANSIAFGDKPKIIKKVV